MAVKTTTDVLSLTKYNEVDMPEELNVLSDDMQKIDDYAGEINTWKETVDDKIDELEEEIDVLQPQSIIALENKVNANAAAIDNLTTDVSSIRQRVTAVEGRADNIEAEQIVQNNRLDTIEAEQIVQNETINNLSDDITNVNTNLTNYETATNARLNTIESDITQLKSEDEIITTQLSTHATELADHEERISALEGGSGSTIPQRVTDLETEVGVLDSSVQGLNTDMDNAESAIGTLQTTVSGLSTDMTNAQSAIGDLQTTVSGHTSSIASINISLSNHQSSINQLENNFSDLDNRMTDVEDVIEPLNENVTNYDTPIKIIKTVNSGSIYSQQLGALYSDLISLSYNQKSRAAIMLYNQNGNSFRIIPIQMIEPAQFTFSGIDNKYSTPSALTITTLIVNQNSSEAYEYYIDSNGFSDNDISGNTNNGSIRLVLI